MITINDSYKEIFFFDAPSETGISFSITLNLASIHAQSQTSLTGASSEIIATFSKGG